MYSFFRLKANASFFAHCIAPVTGEGILAAKFEIGEITCFQIQLQTN